MPFRPPARLQVVLLGALLVTGLGLTASLGALWRSQHVWDPLGRYPVQQVLNIGDIPLDRPVLTRGTKCNSTKEPVTVRVTRLWKAIDPPLGPFDVTLVVSIRSPGCDTRVYANDIPAEVQERVTSLAAQYPKQRWIISGTDVPFDEKGRYGRERVWRTEVFTLIAPEGNP